MILKSDIEFIRLKLLPWSGLKSVKLATSSSTTNYPDIWIDMSNHVPVITVTKEWARQDVHERRKRLVHEFLHAMGMSHDESIGYSTYPNKDRFSKMVYMKLIAK